jgi:hypothetical protein
MAYNNETNEFVLQEMDLTKKKRDQNLYRYVIAYSKYLKYFKNTPRMRYMYEKSTGNFVGTKIFNNMEQSYAAFLTIKDELLSIARDGCVEAISKYLFLEKPYRWDKCVVAIAKEIEKKPIKSPEEWEMVAYLHFADEIYAYGEPRILNMCDLFHHIIQSDIMFDEIYEEYTHGRYCDPNQMIAMSEKECENTMGAYLNKYKYFKSCAINQCPKFVEAVKQAQLGYYQKFLKNGRNLEDLSHFMAINVTPYHCFKEREKLEGLAVNTPTHNFHLSVYLKDEFKRLKKTGELDIVDKCCFVEAMDKIDGYAPKARKMNALLSDIENAQIFVEQKKDNSIVASRVK